MNKYNKVGTELWNKNIKLSMYNYVVNAVASNRAQPVFFYRKDSSQYQILNCENSIWKLQLLAATWRYWREIARTDEFITVTCNLPYCCSRSTPTPSFVRANIPRWFWLIFRRLKREISRLKKSQDFWEKRTKYTWPFRSLFFCHVQLSVAC